MLIERMELKWNFDVARYEGRAEVNGLSVEFRVGGQTLAEAIASVWKRALIARIEGINLARERRKFEEEVRRVFRLG